MNINRKRQSQFELFPGSVKPAYIPENPKTPRFTKDLTLSLENIIVLCIIFVMTLVLFFSFGVERGKRIVMVMPDTNSQVIMDVGVKGVDTQKNSPESAMGTEKRVVFPVQVPEEVTEEREADVDAPVEKIEEQENLFTIQVASFKTREYAQKEADRLKAGGHADSFVVAKGNYTIVCVGKFAQKQKALYFSRQLKRKYNDLLVRRF